MQKTDYPFELLIHDDASTDGTEEIIREYEKKYPAIVKPIYETENQWIKGRKGSAIFNYPRAKGKYIAICEGDDYWTDPYKLQKQVDILEAHPEYSICVHDVDTVFEGVPKSNPFSIRWINDTFTFEDVVVDHFVPTLSIVYRKSSFSSIPNWFADCIVGDKPLVLILLSHGDGYYIHDVMGVKRKNLGGITSNKDRKFIRSEGLLSMYRNIDRYTQRRYKLLGRKIASLEWSIGVDSFAKAHFVKGGTYILQSIRFDVRLVMKKILKKLFQTSV